MWNKGHSEDNSDWDRKMLENLLQSQVIEQRRTRRWGIFFKFLLFVYLFALLFLFRAPEWGWSDWLSDKEPSEHIAVVDLEGLISSASNANAGDFNKALRSAFEHEDTRAVMLRINSGGGSPVQSAMMFDEIQRLRLRHAEIPVYAVISDIGASGAYYVAAAADEIYAHPASVVGSIGVRLDSFGVVDLMERWGIERRLFTAGENKAFLDPFSPLEEDDVQHVQSVIQDIHEQFIEAVRAGRGERLLHQEEKVFSGLIWTGREALDLGLIDGLGDARSVARDVIGIEEMVLFEPRRSALQQLLDDLGVAATQWWFTQAGRPLWR